jgi:HlyD family secretion protein
MSARNRFFILLGIIFVIAAAYYFFSTDHSRDLVLIGTVDSNQVIVSAQVEGRIQKLLVEEGTLVKAGDLIAVLDPSELQTQEACNTKSPKCSTPRNPPRDRLQATWRTRRRSFLR